MNRIKVVFFCQLPVLATTWQPLHRNCWQISETESQKWPGGKDLIFNIWRLKNWILDFFQIQIHLIFECSLVRRYSQFNNCLISISPLIFHPEIIILGEYYITYQANKKVGKTRIQVQIAVAVVENTDTNCITCTEYFCHFLKRVTFEFINIIFTIFLQNLKFTSPYTLVTFSNLKNTNFHKNIYSDDWEA